MQDRYRRPAGGLTPAANAPPPAPTPGLHSESETTDPVALAPAQLTAGRALGAVYAALLLALGGFDLRPNAGTSWSGWPMGLALLCLGSLLLALLLLPLRSTLWRWRRSGIAFEARRQPAAAPRAGGLVIALMALWALGDALVAGQMWGVPAGVILGEVATSTLVRTWRLPQTDAVAASNRLGPLVARRWLAAGLTPPSVGIDMTPARPLAVVAVTGRRTRLLVASSLLARLGDDEVDALLCHELAHLRRGDLRIAARNSAVIRLVAFVAAAAGVLLSPEGLADLPVAAAGGMVAVTAVAVLLAIPNRRRELQADADAAAAAGPVALSGGLRHTYEHLAELRAIWYSPRWLELLLRPVTWSLPSHPPLSERLSRLAPSVGAATDQVN